MTQSQKEGPGALDGVSKLVVFTKIYRDGCAEEILENIKKRKN